MRAIPTRKFSAPFVKTEEFWNGSDPARTIFFDALGLLIPLFERFITTVLIWHRHRATTSVQKKALKALLQQEIQHLHGHERHISDCLENSQVDISTYQSHFLRITQTCAAFSSKNFLLSCAVAMEHWIASFSDTLLRNPNDYLKEADPTIAALWCWHAVEEIEHKAVAFELQKALHIHYWQRSLAMICVSLVFIYAYWRNIFLLIRFHQLPFKTSSQVFTLWCGKKGLLTRSLGKWSAFFKPSFHPWTHQPNIELLKAWYPRLEGFVKERAVCP